MSSSTQEPLAIVGIGCRFPGDSNDPESFWKLLTEGRSGIREVPEDRWNIERYYNSDGSIPIKMITKWGGFLKHVDQFDAAFFGISPREAQRMDPQQRWLLEVTWEALEDAGQRPSDWRGSSTGVFVGISSNEYGSIQMMGEADIDVHTNSGSTRSIASNRISYLYDFKGPAVSVDTACSSALVAVNMACKSIWSGDCDAALAGGVNALLMPDSSIGFSKATMLSPSGQCFAFDARANGYVRGEGAGMIVIKPLNRALEDRDRIYATIRAAVVNQDGNTSSMTVPGQDSQEAMLREAYNQAGIHPSRVNYMEAHGTGTPVGDPIETRAIGEVLSEGRSEQDECIIGSVKSNIGHLESGSGIAGLIKAALVLHHREVPKNLNFETPNPNIPFKEMKLRVPTENMSLPCQGDLLPVSAVNSFGFGGTNAHIVLEASLNQESVDQQAWSMKPSLRPFMLPLSANGDASLRRVAESYRDFLAQGSASISDICATAGSCRQRLDDRLVVIGNDCASMRIQLKSWILNSVESTGSVGGKSSVNNPSPVFVFTGQGVQWWGMGQGLFETEPVFRSAIEEIDALFQPLSGWSLVREMTADEENSKIDRTDIAQPAIFALQVALAKLWKSWGVCPAKVIGHSVGEVAAAYVAGIYNLKDAVHVIYHRSRLQNTTGGRGRMVALGVSQSEAKKLIRGYENEIKVAVVNGPGMVTLAGDTEPLEFIIKSIEKNGTFVRWLRIDYAFHTHQMEPIKSELLEALENISPNPATVPFYSTVTGKFCEGEALDNLYWWRNVREPVLFASVIKELSNEESELFLELGPHPALAGPITDCVGEIGKKCAVMCSLKRNEDETATILENLAGLYVEGVEIDWTSVNRSNGQRATLPTYAWNHERFWIECDQSYRHRLQAFDHPLLGLRKPSPKPTWEFRLDPRELKYLDDHRFWDSIIFPAAGYVEIGLAIARNLFPEDSVAVEELVTEKALFVSEKNVPSVRVVYTESDKSFTVYSTSDEGKNWERNAHGFLRKVSPDPAPIEEDVESIKGRMQKHSTHQEYYDEYQKAGYQFGPNFRQLLNVWSRPNESVAEIEVPSEVVETASSYYFQPAVLDACFHALKGAQVIPKESKTSENFYLPAAIRRVHLYRDRAPDKLWAHVVVKFDDRESVIADITVIDQKGDRVADILGFRVDRIEQKDEESEAIDNSFYEFRWELKRLRGSRVDGKVEFAKTSDIVEAVDAGKNERYERYELSKYLTDFAGCVDNLACRCIEEAYKDLGWKPRPGGIFDTESLFEDLGIVAEHHRLAAAQLKALSVDGVLEDSGDGQWKLIREIGNTDVVQELAKMREMFPDYSADLDLYDMAWPRLAEVLSGETDPLEVLFPGGSSEKLESFYISGADFPANNEMLAVAVEKAVQSVPEHRAVRILEVGAGTGSLTRSVLEKLPSDRIDYTFTDSGPAFISEAKKAFSDHSSLEFSVFDIEKDPAGQGICLEAYDLVLATNVIHATSDLKNTFGQLKRCLAEDGMLMFLEVTRSRNGLDLIFGLLKGWWQYTDIDLRPDSALLNRRQWENLISCCGYEDIGSFINTPDPDIAGQTAFVAKRGQSALSQGSETIEEVGSVDCDDASKTGTVLIFSDSISFSEQLAFHFESKGNIVVKVASDQCPSEAVAGIGHIETIIHGYGIDVEITGHTTSEENLIAAQAKGSLHILKLVRALSTTELETPPNIYVLTRAAVGLGEGDLVGGIAMAPMVGLIRVARGEHSEFGWKHIDLAEKRSESEPSDVYEEITLADDESEIGYRNGLRYVNRLHSIRAEDQDNRLQEAVSADGSVLPYKLQVSSPGVLTNLSLNETVRRSPGPGEIEVLVKAGGINFRDIMKALGMYPGNPIDVKWFGDDFSGEVIGIGEGVNDLTEGDEVVGMAPYCFRSFVTVNREMVFKKASHQSFQDAATLPTVFLTAHYALNELARMHSGERVLIHAGTGGVGMAAIQIARGLGLEVFATAGTPEKRDLLLKLGADHSMNSRTLAFADEIIEITQGEGVDCVLNSLAGDFIPKSFSVLRPFGRFIEIGKVDVYNNSKIGLEQLRNNISYFVVDLAQHLQDKPEYVAGMFAELAVKFEAGDYSPLPHTVFPVTEAVEAFRYMAQGKHVGKNVLSFECDSVPVAPCTEDGNLFKPDATYLITGGMSGFGFEVAKWMSRNGASHLVLMSRSGARDESVMRGIERLGSEGIEIKDARGDVTLYEDISRIVTKIDSELPPLKGVIHGAMVIDDQFMVDMDDSCFNKVLHPKMLGAWNLHVATEGMNLDHFICFSSFSTVIGAIKQANYNAGNAFLDALAHYRQARGLPSLTINWGALIGAGFVERNKKTAAYLDKLGMKPYSMADTQDVMSRLFSKSNAQVVASVVDWEQLVKLSPTLSQAPLYGNVVRHIGEGGAGGSVRSQVLAAVPEERLIILEDFIAKQVASVFGTDITKIDRDTALTNIGLDSLMAIELMNRMESDLGINLPMGTVLNGPNIKELAVNLLDQILASDGDNLAAKGTPNSLFADVAVFQRTKDELSEFSLSEGQKALWFLHQLAPESAAYNLVFSSKLTPFVDIESMENAFASLFERHPMLTATFHLVDGEPVQRLVKGKTIDFQEHNASEMNETEIKRLIAKHAELPFNLEKGPLIRLELFRTDHGSHIVLLAMHHIVSDAWSVALLMNDLIESYFSIKSGQSPDYEPLEYRYQDYVDWQQRNLAGPYGVRAAEYWRSELEDAPSALDLPTDNPRPAVQTFNGGRYGFLLDNDLAARVLKLAENQNSTLYSTMLSAFNVLFHRYCAQNDMIVGSPMAGRNQSELGGIIGYFINPVPLRSRIDDDPTFLDFLSRTAATVNGAIEHQDYPLVRIVDDLKAPRDAGRSPLFQVSFAMERVPGIDDQGIAVFLIGKGGHQFSVGDMTVETVDLNLRQAQFEITLVVEESGGQIFGCWQYNRDLFDPDTIDILSQRFSRVLEQVTEDPGLRISEIDLFNSFEASKVISDWNATDADYPEDKGIHHLVTEQAAKTPDAIAVCIGDQTATYEELEALSDRVASELIGRGIESGSTVSLMVDRSIQMVAGTLGILKSGSHYVPLDPDYPANRLKQMLNDSGSSLLLVTKNTLELAPSDFSEVLKIEDCQGSSFTSERPLLNADDLAYVIYTSGSTGHPKGVEISHRAAVNFLTSMRREPGLTRVDRLLAVTTLSFDISLLEIFLPLITGAQVVIATREEARDGRHISRLLDEHAVTVMQATPATWRMLMDSGWEGRNGLKILCGGEAMPRDLANFLVNSADEVWNLYGPTETTVWSTCNRIEEGEKTLSIGSPIANTSIYILDKNSNLQPPGFVGELCIGGAGLANGYRGQEELTSERFIMVDILGTGEQRLYRTGDLARWRSDGKLECLGRIDFQIKLRGVRMELGEIESVLTSYEAVNAAIVTKREDLPGGEALVAYLVPEEQPSEDLLPSLKSYLLERLPAIMVPTYYEFLDAMPLTPNQKIDRRRLPTPEASRATFDVGFIAPRTSSEQVLAEIFNIAFTPRKVGVRDNFFELGGDSLMAVKIAIQLSSAFDQEIPLDAFFRFPTIEQLARYIDLPNKGEPERKSISNGETFDSDYLSLQLVEDNDEDALPRLDAVALAYIPESFAAVTGLGRSELVSEWFGGQPRLTNTYSTPWGIVGVVMLPIYEIDLYKDTKELRPIVLDGLRLAGRLGAKNVSLTGALSVVTKDGVDLVNWMNDEEVGLPIITTGDATRSATIVKSVEGILEQAARELSGQSVAFIGLGSMGRGTLDLMLDVLPHPEAITLCDFYRREERLEGLQDQLLASGFLGEITICSSTGQLPQEVYEADLIVAATNVPNIIDIDEIRSGTLLVDYSFPPSFSVADAARRIVDRGDLLFTTGGQLRMKEEVEECILLPRAAEEILEKVGPEKLQALASRDGREMTGCILASIFTGMAPGVGVTLGGFTGDEALMHYRFINGLGFKPARLQMDGYFVPSEAVQRFRGQSSSESSSIAG